VQRGTRDPGELDGAVRGLRLQQHLADLAVVAGVGLPARELGVSQSARRTPTESSASRAWG
ncbi:hypothetical protein, partial [Streptomyces sp. NPDC059564]|uniref:hypothetical protein n=1 Tax=Streptomyces sp. NPDC059564 TaxID=3346865 RepID=UPI00367DBBC5